MSKTYEEKCKERCYFLSEQMIYANQTYSVLMQIRDLIENHNEIANVSPTFYQTVIQNCIQVLFIEISKMFDTDPSSESIRSLLDSMKKNLPQLNRSSTIEVCMFERIFDTKSYSIEFQNIEELIEKSINMIESYEKESHNVKKQRDKYYVHYDRQTTIDIILQNYNVSYFEIGELLTLNTNLCNALYMYFFNHTVFPLFVDSDDFIRTLKVMEEIRNSNNEFVDS